MHKNSLEPWYGEVKPNLRKRQLQVLKVLKAIGGSGTARDVMSATGQTSNVIHPRLGELRDLEYVKEAGNKKINGRKFTIYKVTEKGESTDTEKVEDIKAAKKYYSKEDYKTIVREVYDHLATDLNPEESKELYEKLRLFLSTK